MRSTLAKVRVAFPENLKLVDDLLKGVEAEREMQKKITRDAQQATIEVGESERKRKEVVQELQKSEAFAKAKREEANEAERKEAAVRMKANEAERTEKENREKAERLWGRAPKPFHLFPGTTNPITRLFWVPFQSHPPVISALSRHIAVVALTRWVLSATPV